jgi:hypothetical protein
VDKAVYLAFELVCLQEMRLEPESVLRAHLGALEPEAIETGGLKGAKPDRAAVRRWRELFERVWRARVG